MPKSRVGIVSGVRTPFVKSGAQLANIPAYEIGRIALSELMARSPVKHEEIDEIIFGNVAQPMEATNIARVIALHSGFPLSTSAQTVARNCASGMQSIASGYELIKSGSAQCVIAGGTESMSNIPLMYPKSMADILGKLAAAKKPAQKLKVLSQIRPADFKPIIALVEGLKDPFCGLNMGQTAEILAKEFGVRREEQDRFALLSHQKVAHAWENRIFDEEVVPVFPQGAKEAITKDIGYRADQSLEALAKLKPYFDRDHGTVTVGNACPITDGAAAIFLASEDWLESRGVQPLAWIKSYAFAGLDPKRMGLGPIASSTKALRIAGMNMAHMQRVEINEAFAAQVLAVLKICSSPGLGADYGAGSELSPIDPNLLNVHGGAIALGHPVGTSGTRIVLTLALELKRQNMSHGLATLCIGGGQGGAMILERT